MGGFYDNDNGLCSSEPESQNDSSSNMSVDPYSGGMSNSNSGGGSGNHSGGSSFYPDPNSQNMTMADGSNSHQSNQASNANSSNLCSYYDYGNNSCTEPGAANMSYDSTSSGDTGNFYSSLYSSNASGSSGSGGYDPGMSCITDIPISPHLVLNGAGEDVSVDQPALDVLLVGPDGSMSGETLTLKTDEKGRLHWNAINATNALVNGQSVPLNGSIDIPFNKQFIGSDMPYEVVAWKNKQENSTIRLLSVKMSDSVAVGRSEEVNFKLKKPVGNGLSFKYWKISGEIEFTVAGKFTSNKSDSVNAGLSNNDVAIKATFAKLSKQIDFVTLQCSLKGSFKIPKDITPKEENGKSVWAELGASAETSAVFKIGNTCEVTVGGTMTLINVKVARDIDGFQWECKCGGIEIALSDSDKFTYKCDDGVFEISFQFSGKIKADPNWPAIIKEVCVDYGESLGIDSLTAGLGVAAAVVTSPAVLAAGCVATIGMGLLKISEGGAPAYFRTVTIPKIISSLERGLSDGLKGLKSESSNHTIVDENSAYLAGVYSGSQKRADLEAHNEPFDAKSEKDKQMVISIAGAQIKSKLEIDLWVMQSSDIKGRLLSSDREKVYMQMSTWNNTIGNCPVSKGGTYLDTWYKNRYDAPDAPYYSGNW